MFKKLELEHLKSDWDGLARINKSEDDDQRVHGGPGGLGGVSSDKLARKYFSQITKQNITRLFRKYQLDFEMFGYESHVQQFIDMGS